MKENQDYQLQFKSTDFEIFNHTSLNLFRVQKDFTYNIYSGLIASLKKTGYVFLPFIDFISNGSDGEKCIALRHDIDRLPENALKMARMENNAGIRASYYFRIVKESYDENVIRQIADLGHEIGYHYEDLNLSLRGLGAEVGDRRAEVGYQGSDVG